MDILDLGLFNLYSK